MTAHRIIERSSLHTLLSTVALCSSLVSTSNAQVATALIRQGNALPGGDPAHLVTDGAVSNSATNHAGGYAFTANTSDGVATLSHAWGSAAGGIGAVLRSEGTFGTYTQTSWETFFGIGDLAQVAYSPLSNAAGGGTGLDGVWRDDDALAVESVPMTNVPGLETLFWSFASRPGITADGRAYWVGGTRTTPTGTTSARGLFIENGKNVDTLLYSGVAVPDLPFPPNPGTAVDFDYRVSALATHYIAPVIMASGSTTNDGTVVKSGAGLLVDGQLVREGSLVPVAAGGDGAENWAFFDFFGIAEDGTYFFSGDSSAATTVDEFIFKNGQMLYREGSVIDGATTISAIQHAYMNDDADIAYVWETVAAPANLETLFLNDQLLLKETDLVDLDGDGVTEPNSLLVDFTGISSLTMSDRDVCGNVQLYFTADIDVLGTPTTTDDIEGGFRLFARAVPCAANIVTAGASATQVDIDDLLLAISAWGPCPLPCPAVGACCADIDLSCTVDIDDLLAVISAWGPCP